MMSKLSTKPDTELVNELLNAFNEAIHAEKLFQDYLGMLTCFVTLNNLFVIYLSFITVS
jgi:hypothetical protein